MNNFAAGFKARHNEIESLKARIAQLENSINDVAIDIIGMDNLEQDSDEMEECWTSIKEFALLATGRCDT